jgi:hypothetical protein
MEEEEAFHYEVNLAELETAYEERQVFSRELLLKIKNDRQTALDETQEAWKERLRFIQYTNRFGTFNIWDGEMQEPDDDFVGIRYMSRAELHPDFQKVCWKFSETNKSLRRYNQELTDEQKTWIPVPYVLTMGERVGHLEHKHNEVMRAYCKRLRHTKKLWLHESDSQIKLVKVAEALASQFSSITKIVCIGLGAIKHTPAFYQSALQHMAAFSIARTIENSYKIQGLFQKTIDIILQDPCYSLKDIQLLKAIYSGPLVHATDPEGILAIDSHTIVMTAHLPVTMPLMQIIADLSEGHEENQPAAILCDNMKLDIHKEMYSLSDRSSPSVARFLTEKYDVSDFQDHYLEKLLWEDIYGDAPEDSRDLVYWLSRAQLYTRK